jgi:hypothetical protein
VGGHIESSCIEFIVLHGFFRAFWGNVSIVRAKVEKDTTWCSTLSFARRGSMLGGWITFRHFLGGVSGFPGGGGRGGFWRLWVFCRRLPPACAVWQKTLKNNAFIAFLFLCAKLPLY